MEIYRNEPAQVKFRAPLVNGNYSVTLKSVDLETTIPSVSVENDEVIGPALNIPIDYGHTFYNGTIEIKINVNGQRVYSEWVDVVTPLFRHEDLGDEYPREHVPELESLVRQVIQARTGQVFGRFRKAVPAEGDGAVIRFDVPLIELHGVSKTGRWLQNSTTLTPPKQSYEVATDGMSMSIDWSNYDVKTDSFWMVAKRDYGVKFIHGDFGYDRVPADVKQAALLIAGVWGCKQAVWRDRFIQTMRSSDWSVQYNDGAYASTGSTTADQLLEKYIRRYSPEVI